MAAKPEPNSQRSRSAAGALVRITAGQIMEAMNPQLTWSSQTQMDVPWSDSRDAPDGSLLDLVTTPKPYRMHGQTVRLYCIGAIAEVLGRDAGTVRRWEREGILPISGLRRGSKSWRGQRRLYTADMVALIQRIAKEEGLLASKRLDPKDTEFSARAHKAFKEIADRPPAQDTASHRAGPQVPVSPGIRRPPRWEELLRSG